MDFLSAALAYIMLSALLGLVYYFRQSPLIHPLFSTLRVIQKLMSFCVPRCVFRPIFEATCWFLFARHPLFQIFYVGLVLVGHVVLVNDVIRLLYRLSDSGNHIFSAFICLLFNFVSYVLTCFSDPGYITQQNLQMFSEFFPYDNLIYVHRVCRNCRHVIPARARHCNRCDRCVFRFEHHCVLTNCCIGGLNYVHFLIFLTSTLAMLVNAVWQATHLLTVYTNAEGLWNANFLDSSGHMQIMDWSTLVQHLFMTFPRVVGMVAILSALAVMLAGYLCFHLWLVLTNQTTYECNVQSTAGVQQDCSLDVSAPSNDRCYNAGVRYSGVQSITQSSSPNTSQPSHNIKGRFYDRGLWNNICEVLGFRTRDALRELRRRLPAQMEFKTQ